jgi:hypothetical protein
MTGVMQSLITVLTRMLTRPAGRQVIAIVGMLCIGCAMAAWIVPAPVRAFNDNTSGVVPIAPLKPQLTATVIVPGQIGFCNNFNFHVSLINYGNATAKNTHLFFKQFPGGFFSLVNIDQFSSTVSRYTEDIILGDLKANQQKEINFVVYVPLQSNLNAEWLRRFSFNFTTSYDYMPEQLMGSIIFLAGHGKIHVQTTGFIQ